MITQERLKEILHYDPDTGVFTRIKCHGNSRLIGKPAGKIKEGDYTYIRVDGKIIKAHRLAFLYMTGSIPDYIDHVNGVRGDDRWCNLRPATRSTNAMNRKMRSDNSSGAKGVSWHKRDRHWVVSIMVSGKVVHYSTWDDLEAAELVAILAREKYHGEFAKHG